MALNDSCHLLIETKHDFLQKSGGGWLEQNLWGGLEPLSPIASAATELQFEHEQTQTNKHVFINKTLNRI